VIVDANGLMMIEGKIATTPSQRGEFATSVILEDVPHPGMGSIILGVGARRLSTVRPRIPADSRRSAVILDSAALGGGRESIAAAI